MARAPALQEIEDIPELDRLDGFPHPRETVRLFGHAAAELTLAEALAGGRMHHAWLLAGPEGVGKATLAYRFARYALARDEERIGGEGALDVAPEGIAARQVRALSHPGLLVIRRGYDVKAKRFPAAIPVEEVRRLKGFLGHTVGAEEWRAVIVDRADELNISAANALLKSLEEPPSRTVFLLVSGAEGRLLPTIRSRCRTLALAPLGTEDLRKAATQALVAAGEEIAASAPSPREWTALERLSAGSVRRALSLHGGRGIELYERVFGLLSSLPDPDWGRIHALADELASPAAEQRYELFFELVMDLLSRLIEARVLGAKSGARASAEERELAESLIGEDRLATWAELWERVAADKAAVQALNLDRKALILEVFSRLASAASRLPKG